VSFEHTKPLHLQYQFVEILLGACLLWMPQQEQLW